MSKSNIQKVMEALGEQARENENITYEELQILKQVSYDLSEYERALKAALEDGVITDKENAHLTKMKNDIEKNVLTVANIDKVVDEEEQGMISKLCEVLDKYL